jgi:hypothetical protein
MGRVPSMQAVTTEPGAFLARSDKNTADGLGTCSKPDSFISNTPISLVEPNRFLTARRMRNTWFWSPSKYSTVSTMCSMILGPAMAPSLVTWPIKNAGIPVCLAMTISFMVASRTWVTLPGAEAASFENMV